MQVVKLLCGAVALLSSSALADEEGIDDETCVGEMVPKGISAEEVVERVFSVSDVDNSNSLDVDELASASLAEKYLALLAVFDHEQDGFDIADYPNFLGAYDASEDGVINRHEFLSFLQHVDEFNAAFIALDRDKSSSLTIGEVRRLNPDAFDSEEDKQTKADRSKVLGISMFDRNKDGWLTENEVNELGAATDLSNDHRIEYAEVLSHVARLRSSTHGVAPEITSAAFAAVAEKGRAKAEAEADAEEDIWEDDEPAAQYVPKKPTPKPTSIDDMANRERAKEIIEEKLRAKRERLLNNIPTPTGRESAARRTKQPKNKGKVTLTEDQLKHFLTPAQLKAREQKKLKADRKKQLAQENAAQSKNADPKESKVVADFKRKQDEARTAFQAIDENQDGAVSESEVKLVVAESFHDSLGTFYSKMDSNNDGKVTRKEFAMYFPMLRSHIRSPADILPLGGTIRSRRVVQAKSGQAKKLFDANVGSDGFVSADSLARFKLPEGGVQEFLKQHDSDGDGKLSLAEFTNGFPEISKAASIARRGRGQASSSNTCANHEPEMTEEEAKNFRKDMKARHDERLKSAQERRSLGY